MPNSAHVILAPGALWAAGSSVQERINRQAHQITTLNAASRRPEGTRREDDGNNDVNANLSTPSLAYGSGCKLISPATPVHAGGLCSSQPGTSVPGPRPRSPQERHDLYALYALPNR